MRRADNGTSGLDAVQSRLWKSEFGVFHRASAEVLMR